MAAETAGQASLKGTWSPGASGAWDQVAEWGNDQEDKSWPEDSTEKRDGRWQDWGWNSRDWGCAWNSGWWDKSWWGGGAPVEEHECRANGGEEPKKWEDWEDPSPSDREARVCQTVVNPFLSLVSVLVAQ